MKIGRYNCDIENLKLHRIFKYPTLNSINLNYKINHLPMKTGKKSSQKSAQSDKPNLSPSMFEVIVVCGVYAFFSGSLVTINKKIYMGFGAVSPLNLLMVQCMVNLTISTLMMLYKEFNNKAYISFEKYGIVIRPLSSL